MTQNPYESTVIDERPVAVVDLISQSGLGLACCGVLVSIAYLLNQGFQIGWLAAVGLGAIIALVLWFMFARARPPLQGKRAAIVILAIGALCVWIVFISVARRARHDKMERARELLIEQHQNRGTIRGD